MRWTVHGERVIYRSEWVGLSLVDVELPDGTRLEHHVVRVPRPAVGVVVTDPALGVLLLWRHRFITDTWGWEVPAGRVEVGEDPADAARREVREETGWAVGEVTEVVSYHPSNGLSDQRFTVFVGSHVRRVGPPSDTHEAARVAWVDPSRVERLIAAGEVRDGLSLTALSLAVARGLLGSA